MLPWRDGLGIVLCAAAAWAYAAYAPVLGMLAWDADLYLTRGTWRDDLPGWSQLFPFFCMMFAFLSLPRLCAWMHGVLATAWLAMGVHAIATDSPDMLPFTLVSAFVPALLFALTTRVAWRAHRRSMAKQPDALT